MYPTGEDYYSPAEMYPEYRYAHLSSKPNPVYRAVRDVFVQAALDQEHLGTPEWNPLRVYIPEGSKVFILCNFVYHRRLRECQLAFWSKCTHGSVLRAVLDYILLAIGPSGKVTFGNAPLQSCHWNEVLQETGANRVLEFYQQRNVQVQAQDLRLFVAPRRLLGNVAYVERRDETSQAVEVDLGETSLLVPLDNSSKFRVTDYDPRRIRAYHADGHHIYVINRAVLESDVIFSLPKLKTHEKVGLTCTIKGFVGAIGRKDCLAHHRFGSPDQGGDEYSSNSRLLLRLSEFHDWINRQDLSQRKTNLSRTIDWLARILLRKMGITLAGAWHGNDTAWRMALDITRILMYATATGDMQPNLQRKHLTLIDGIVGGEGEGPLSPRPIKSGTLLFADDVGLCDWACCRLIGFDPDKIPLVKEAIRLFSKPNLISGSAHHNGQTIQVQALTCIDQRPFKPPRGWHNYVELADCEEV